MNGLLLTHIQQNGRMLLKATIAILVFALLLSGCSVAWWVGDGRGDWTLNLYKGYAICKVNSREILFIHKEDPNDSRGTTILPNYFLTRYQLNEPYICLEGICTQSMAASEEELKNKVLSYYLVDTSNGEVTVSYTHLTLPTKA